MDNGITDIGLLLETAGRIMHRKQSAHAKGNMNLGNDRDFLIRIVSQCLPYIGYPRSLNAVNCVNKAAG